MRQKLRLIANNPNHFEVQTLTEDDVMLSGTSYCTHEMRIFRQPETETILVWHRETLIFGFCTTVGSPYYGNSVGDNSSDYATAIYDIHSKIGMA